ncbi:secreted phosphoprotein 24 [Sardina pilchardus]|uniref:secreted phosphoprotein 24 n=1 Tax=Sardina pilchardus TaxID=27697 RepID=UPI002E0FEE7A
MKSSFRPAADLAQRVALTQLNRHATSPFLFRVNRRTVQQISEVGFNTYDMDLQFGVRESVCPVGSENYLDRCATMWNPSAVEGLCSSRVRVSAHYALLLELRCMIDSSSSESSSSEEEMVRVRAPIAAQVPGIVLCRGAARRAKGLRGGSAAEVARLPERTRETDPYRRPLALSDGSVTGADRGPGWAPRYLRSASIPDPQIRHGSATDS